MIIVEGVEDILQILSDFKALNTMYVEDVEDRSNTPKGCNAMYVEDRSNTPKGCNAMYVKDIKTSHNRFLTDFLEFI